MTFPIKRMINKIANRDLNQTNYYHKANLFVQLKKINN